MVSIRMILTIYAAANISCCCLTSHGGGGMKNDLHNVHILGDGLIRHV